VPEGRKATKAAISAHTNFAFFSRIFVSTTEFDNTTATFEVS